MVLGRERPRPLIPKTDVFRVSNQRVVRVDKNGVEWQAGVMQSALVQMMLPTPSTFDALDFKKKNLEDKTTKNGKRGGRSNLREVDFTKLSGEEIGEAGESRQYVLNPQFVEAMMGFPTGWTDLKLSETP
jgi:hypothetical protein